MPVVPLGCGDRTRILTNRTRYADSLIKRQNFDDGLTNRIDLESGSGSARESSIMIPLKEGANETTFAEQQAILQNAIPFISISQNAVFVNEGGSVVFTVTTPSVRADMNLFFTTTGTASASDFTDNTLLGSFGMSDGVAQLTRSITLDFVSDPGETFVIEIRTGSTSGPIVATSSTVTITNIPMFTWTEQTGAPTIEWISMDSTTTGTTAIATRRTASTNAEGPYITRDGGATWTRSITGMSFPAAVFSSDITVANSNASIMFSANRGTPSVNAPIWRSQDGGSNWSSATSPASALWQAIKCSANGQVVVAGNASGYTNRIAVSTNGGTSWTGRSSGLTNVNYSGLCLSASGTRIYGINSSSAQIRRSTDTGSNWTAVGSAALFQTIACSADGLTVVAAPTVGSGSTTYPYMSIDGGTTWSNVTAVGARRYWGDCSISEDGLTILVSSGNFATGTLWATTNGGQTWIEQTTAGSRLWASSAINGDGTKIFAGLASGKVWIGTR